MKVYFSSKQQSFMKNIDSPNISEEIRRKDQAKQNEMRINSLKKGLLGGGIIGLLNFSFLSITKANNKIIKSLEVFAATALAIDLGLMIKDTYKNIKKNN